jgi:hypothetical protein
VFSSGSDWTEHMDLGNFPTIYKCQQLYSDESVRVAMLRIHDLFTNFFFPTRKSESKLKLLISKHFTQD